MHDSLLFLNIPVCSKILHNGKCVSQKVTLSYLVLIRLTHTFYTTDLLMTFVYIRNYYLQLIADLKDATRCKHRLKISVKNILTIFL